MLTKVCPAQPMGPFVAVLCDYCGAEFHKRRYKVLRAEREGFRHFCCPSHRASGRYGGGPQATANSDDEYHRMVNILASINSHRKDIFWSHVERSDDPKACWPWLACLDRHGYGMVRIRTVIAGAHQVAFMLNGNLLNKGCVVRHSCDNPPCCNPNHLLAGTYADNSADMVKRERSKKGSKLPQSRLRDADVRAIRSDPRSLSVLAAIYGVAPQTIQHVKAYRTWRHL